MVLVVDMPRAADRAAAAAGREAAARQHKLTLCSGDLVASGTGARTHSCLAFVAVAEATRRGRGGAWFRAAEPTTPRRALLPNTCSV